MWAVRPTKWARRALILRAKGPDTMGSGGVAPSPIHDHIQSKKENSLEIFARRNKRNSTERNISPPGEIKKNPGKQNISRRKYKYTGPK